MSDLKAQTALGSPEIFEISPLTTDQLNGITSIDLSALNNSTIQLGAVGQGYTLTSGSSMNWQMPTNGYNLNASVMDISQSGKVSVHGENADVEINGKSMKAWMEKVEERLNILTPNPELEKEWDDLRKLGERYRKLEKKCKEKAETWNKLKAMPPPTVD